MLPPLCPNRKEHAHMTLRRHALPRPLRPSEAGATFNDCRSFSPRPLRPRRKGHARMTLRRSTSPRLRHRSGEGQRSPPVEPSGFTTHVLSMQGRARSHDVVPYASSRLPCSHGEGHGSPRCLAHSKPASSARALRKFYSTFLPGFACLIRKRSFPYLEGAILLECPNGYVSE